MAGFNMDLDASKHYCHADRWAIATRFCSKNLTVSDL